MSMSAINDEIVALLLRERVIFSSNEETETAHLALEAIQDNGYAIVERPQPNSNQMDPPHNLGFTTPDFSVRAKRREVRLWTVPDRMTPDVAEHLASALLGAAAAARGQR